MRLTDDAAMILHAEMAAMRAQQQEELKTWQAMIAQSKLELAMYTSNLAEKAAQQAAIAAASTQAAQDAAIAQAAKEASSVQAAADAC
jgi:hypothetical protein